MAIEAARLFVKVGSDTREAEQGLTSFNDRLNKAARDLTMTGGLLTAGLTLPLVAAGKAALDSAADFEQSMNILQQVAGASADQMSALSAQALELGASTSFSAGEAASAMLELAKAGMGVDDVMASIGGVMQLAAAGGVELATAANVTASALNAFGLGAEQSAYVANLLAAAANASAANISDLAAGLQQGGFAFAATGQEIDDLAASLAILTNVGLTGSDAGTALKNALTRLMNPTEEAKELMESLGIDVYDAQGQMLALSDIIAELNGSMAAMTMEQRNSALATIFLSDGMKAMMPLLDVGEEGFLAMKDAVNEEGSAARVADARMAGLSGAIEYFKGSVDSFLIGTARPYLNMLGEMVRSGADLLTGFGQMSASVRNASLAFLGVVAAAGPVLAGIGAIVGGLAFLLTPLGLVVAGSAALAAAWAGDFWGIRDITADALGSIGDTIAGWWSTAEPYISAARAAISVLWTGLTGEGDVATVMENLETISGVFGPDFATRVSEAGLALDRFVTTARSVDLDALWGDTTSLAQIFTGQVAAQLGLEVDWSALQVNATDLVTVAGDRLSTADWNQMVVDAQGMTWRAGQQLTQSNWSDMSMSATGMVTRAGEHLTTVDWSQMAVNFGGLISVAGDKITEQADNILGEGNILSHTISKIRGTFSTLQDLGEGASIDDPLDLLNRAISGAISIANLIGGIKSDFTVTAITTLQGLLTEVLNFSRDLVAGVNAEQVAKGATSLVTGFIDQIVALTQPEQLGAIGTAAGGLVSEIISQLGNVLGSEGFGEEVGTAIGAGAVAIAAATSSLVDGFASELAATDWGKFSNQLDEFVKGLLLGVVKGAGNAIWEPSIFNPEVREKALVGEIESGFGELPAVDWTGIGESIADGYLKMIGANPQVTVGPMPILSQQEDLLGEQRDRERAAELGTIFGTAGTGVLGLWSWPGIDIMSLGFEWPEIPTPKWLSDLFNWAGMTQESAARAADTLDEIEEVADRVRNSSSNSGGGGSNDNGAGDDDDGGFDPNQPNFPTLAYASAGGPVIQITGPIHIHNGMDIEELAYNIIQRIRRGA